MSQIGGEDKYSEIRSRYEEQVLGDLRGIREQLDAVKRDVLELKITFATADLPSLKQRVERTTEVLQRHDPEKIAATLVETKKEYDDRLDKVEKFQTRALAILTFLNVLLGVFAIFREYIFPRRAAAQTVTQTGLIVWRVFRLMIMSLLS